jgi:hypothetical protein
LQNHTEPVPKEVIRGLLNVKYIHYSQFVEELRQLCLTQTEGIVFVSTDKSELAQINLRGGEIVSLFFLNKHGVEAIPWLKRISRCSYQLVRSAVKNARMTLPPTAEILNILSATDKPFTGTLSVQARTVIKKTLNEFIGPVAAFICDRRLAEIDSLEAAVAALAAEIPDQQEALQFRKRLQNRLKGIN